MKEKKTRLLSILMTLALLCGSLCCPGVAARPADNGSAAPAIIGVEAVPEYQWQRKASFPDWKGYTDDTLAMNSMVSFRFYHAQGTLWLEVSKEVESFKLYINGIPFDTSAVGTGAWAVDFSEASQNGVNTLQISNIMPLGLKNAVTAYIPYPTVEEGVGMEGIRPETLQLISDLIDADVRHGFTSAQLAVVKNGRLVYEDAWGRVNSYEPDGTRKTDSPPVTADTLYDLASVTKMFSINYAVQKLVTDKQLDIDTPIVDILGDEFAEDTLDRAYKGVKDPPDVETQRAWKRALNVKDILRHQAGFPAGPAYYNPEFTMNFTDAEPGVNPCYAVTREDTLKAIFKTPLEYEPGTKTVYSDVDYMLLTYVVEKLTGKRLDEYMKETFYAPLGLEHMTYLPLENGFAADDCAATELCGNTRDRNFFFPGVRTETLQGQVHDEKAWDCMGGVSGHAGLFSNATDLAKLASVMLTGGYGEHRFFSQDVMDLFTAPKSLDYGQWGLGWWREGDDKRVWYFGTQAPSDTIGHQGWTGTLVMIDPSRELVVAYLTNKINSPVVDPKVNLDGFAGKCYTASTLGFVAQILSIGMDTDADISAQLLDLTADMAAESLNKIPEGADADHPYVMNALSKISVLRSRASSAGSEEKLRFADELASMLPYAPEREIADVDGGDASVKRGDAILALYELDGSPMVIQLVVYPDAAGTEYANAAVWAKGAGVVKGYADGLFHGERAVTRAELAAMLYRYAGHKGIDVSIDEDSGISDRGNMPGWGEKEITWALRRGVLTEKEGGETDAWGTVTRAELDAALKKLEESFKQRVILGDEQFDEYVPLLRGKRVALFSNHTGIVGNRTSVSGEAYYEGADLVQLGLDRDGNEVAYGQHILDALIENGVNVTAIFSPEHGFRGTADAGASVDDSVDELTGVPILSLYHNNTHYPSQENMDAFDVLVVDMQDVGLRYYTYYISMYYLMDACASSGKEVLILDRPNPNGFYVDGPILKDGYQSGVGRLPIPVVYGMTWGELARMINGEGWLEAGKDACRLTVIPCKNYSHDMKTNLIRKPSPNIKDMRAVYLYASTCFFENTYVSVGRGTEMPFEIYGSPYLNEKEYTYSFTPQSMEGAAHPPFEDEECNGRSLRDIPLEEIWANGINLDYLIGAYRDFTKEHPDMDFFGNPKSGDRYWIDLLSGSDELRTQIAAGKSAEEIKASWQDDIEYFLEQRQPYLLYD